MIYYDRSVAVSRESYNDYLRTREQTCELINSTKENTEKLGVAIMASTAINVAATQQATRDITSSIETMQNAYDKNTHILDHTISMGFNNLNMNIAYGFNNVERVIGEMGVEINFGLARLNDTFLKSAKIICDKLDVINDTLNNPRFTEARELYRQASTEYSKGFYEDARDDLLKATTIYKADVISWRLLGMVYLFGAGELAGEFCSVVDLNAAITAFFNAAKYVEPDAKAHTEAKLLASDIWFYLGLARLFRSNDLISINSENDKDAEHFLDEALKAFDKSYAFSDKMLEALYLSAKCKMLQRDFNGAFTYLEMLVEEDFRYVQKISYDKDFSGIVNEDKFKKFVINQIFGIKKNVVTRYNGTDKHVVIPDGVTSIGCYAFSNCCNIISITIPKSVINIYEGAFSSCTELTCVIIPNSIISIGDYAFDGCINLIDIDIPKSVTNIGKHAFYNVPKK